jgi:hypothetical protein
MGVCVAELLDIRVDQRWSLAGAAHQCEQSHTLTAKRNQEYQGSSGWGVDFSSSFVASVPS